MTLRLLDSDVHMTTPTCQADGRNALQGLLELAPLDFSDRDELRSSKEGARVGRSVHFPVTNPLCDSEMPYFRGKAQVLEMWRASESWHRDRYGSLSFVEWAYFDDRQNNLRDVASGPKCL